MHISRYNDRGPRCQAKTEDDSTMSAKPSIAEVKTSNAASTWSFFPTAVFVGGTSGVGEGAVKAFAQATNGRAQIIIVARSRTRGEEILASLPKTAESKYDFLQCDAGDPKNIIAASKQLRQQLVDGKLNYLVMSQSVYPWGPPQPSMNGIDLRMVLDFYSRWKFVDELMPLLETAAALEEEARVLTIKGGNGKLPLDHDDLGFRNNPSSMAQTKATSLYNNIMVEEYSRLYPNISFYHIFPGLVDTPGWNVAPWWAKPMLAVARLIMTSSEDSGQRMISALLRPEYKTGGHCLDNFGNPVDARKETPQVRKLVLEHYRKEVAA
ncbi:hypothetical protein FRB90_004290 [Tulasnella sp. 427]|nr:hypothetical protein FRB90_004290 [Tulasnella sp. 427]